MRTQRQSRARAILLAVLCIGGLLSTVISTPASGQTSRSLLLSLSSNRSSPTNLQGSTVAGDIYVFLSPDAGVSKTRFYIDNPTMSGTPFKTENGAPVDLGGTNSAGLAMPFDTTSLTNGSHQLSARIDLTAGGTEAVHTTFTVNNTGEPPPPPPPGDHNLMVSLAPNRSGAVNLEGQVVGDNIYVFTSPAADTKKVRFFVDDPGMNGTPFFIEKGAPFDLMGSTNNGATANPFNTLTLSEGVHNVTASITLSGQHDRGRQRELQRVQQSTFFVARSERSVVHAWTPNESDSADAQRDVESGHAKLHGDEGCIVVDSGANDRHHTADR